RVGEELAVVEDARRARPLQHVVGQDLGPEILDLFRLGEEAVAADVEAKALVLRRAGDAADVNGVGLEDVDVHALARQEVARRQPCGAGTDNRNRLVTHDKQLLTKRTNIQTPRIQGPTAWTASSGSAGRSAYQRHDPATRAGSNWPDASSARRKSSC